MPEREKSFAFLGVSFPKPSCGLRRGQGPRVGCLLDPVDAVHVSERLSGLDSAFQDI